MAALSNLDGDMPQYISDNTDDEISHAAFLNAYLISKEKNRSTWMHSEHCPAVRRAAPKNIGRRQISCGECRPQLVHTVSQHIKSRFRDE